ncbi:hypothetical protein [Acinetobacter sp. PK01]|uniref:hypothetical protein n=1 Tax=Acinetobacter sp. PK01 TaxID=2930198 RepID=UPI001FB841C9|nr:hypothetical protein [Acinetobacter sp. PK01]UOG18656.1 hypothetical protein MP622_03330 [Acinetobacter sp. PK01]
MLYLADFIVGVFSIFIFSLFYYLIKPKHFFLTINHQQLSRGNILLYWFVITLIIFIMLCIAVPKQTMPKDSDVDAILYLIGMVAAFFFLRYGSKKKFNIYKNNKVSVQAKPQNIPESVPEKVPELPSYKEPTLYVSPSSPSYQPWNEIPKFDSDDEDEFHHEVKERSGVDLSALYRYELDYKDRFGKVTTRFIDVTGVQKEWGNNRWYFVADTAEGERTFKSERVIELRDNWTGDVFSTSKSVRDHLVKNYPEVDDAFED